MATYDWASPTTGTNYATFVTELHNRLNETSKQFPSSDTYSNLVVGAISFRNNKWQTWSGAAWVDLASSYAINISGTAANVSGTVSAINGGTGYSTYTIGDLLVGGPTNTISKVSAVAVNNVLLSAGTGTVPTWGKVDLSAHTSTTALPVTKGGLALTAAVTGLLKGNGTVYSAAIEGTDYAAANHTHDYIGTGGGTITGSLSIINGTNEMQLYLGSSGGYFYGNATHVGFFKNAGSSVNIAVATGNLATNGSITAGTGLTVTTGGLTVSSGNLVVTSGTISTGTGNLSVTGSISATGDITASGSVTAYSDIRLKKNICTLEGALDKVRQLTGVSYIKDGEAEIGVIAQEVEKIVPEVVKQAGEYKAVAYGNLVALLIEAIKELDRKLDA